MEREPGIGCRVFVCAVECGLRRQRLHPLEAVPELLRLALEHAPAAKRKHAVAHEGDSVARQVVGDMAVGVARYVDHFRDVLAQRHLVAMRDHAVDRADPLDFLRGDDLRPRSLDDGLVPAGMVGVPVRVPDGGDPPALRRGLAEVFAAIWRVDRRSLPAVGIVQQEAVIV